LLAHAPRNPATARRARMFLVVMAHVQYKACARFLDVLLKTYPVDISSFYCFFLCRIPAETLPKSDSRNSGSVTQVPPL
jgi:hypothetical protein